MTGPSINDNPTRWRLEPACYKFSTPNVILYVTVILKLRHVYLSKYLEHKYSQMIKYCSFGV